MDVWNLVAERKICEAMEEGAFDNLEGTGEPLCLDENPYEDPSLRMAHRILKNNGFAPAWILEGKELDSEIHRLRSERNVPDYAARVAELNRRIAVYNLKVPVVGAQKLLLE
jgi:hypothetical protein